MVYSKNKIIYLTIAAATVVIVSSILIWTRVNSSIPDPCDMYEFLASSGYSADSTETAFLTPLIKSNRIVEAHKKAFVPNWKGVDSYSGFITVNDTSNSNLFFWFFPVTSTHVSSQRILYYIINYSWNSSYSNYVA